MRSHRLERPRAERSIRPIGTAGADRLYFAYGSNTSSRRLRARVPDAHDLGPASLRGFRLLFDKRSQDGSGKANLVRDERALCWGVLWVLAQSSDWDTLDPFEPGYRRRFCRLTTASGGQLSAQLYLHAGERREIAPRAWYLALLLEGAEEHGLPQSWRRQLARTRHPYLRTERCSPWVGRKSLEGRSAMDSR